MTPDGKLYFFDKNSGNAYTNRWAEIDGIWYEFNDQGYAQAKKGEFYTTDGSTYSSMSLSESRENPDSFCAF